MPLKKYDKQLIGTLAIVCGVTLEIEHLWSWGGMTFFDFVGHEWLGLVLILFGMGINTNFKKPDNFWKYLKQNFKRDILDKFKRK